MQTNGDLAVYTVGGASVVPDLFENASMRYTPTQNETKGLTQYGKSRQLSKLGVEFDLNMTSTSGSRKIDYFDVTDFQLGGVDIRCNMYSFDIEGTFEQKEDPSYCSQYKNPSNLAKDYKATIEVGVPDAGYNTLLLAAASTTDATRQCILTCTINGVTTTIQCTFDELEFAIADADNYRVRFTVLGDSPFDGSAYPTAPTGTASLLAWAFNGAKTVKAVVFKTHATVGAGIQVSCNAILQSFSFGARDGEVIKNNYKFVSKGTVTVASS